MIRLEIKRLFQCNINLAHKLNLEHEIIEIARRFKY